MASRFVRGVSGMLGAGAWKHLAMLTVLLVAACTAAAPSNQPAATTEASPNETQSATVSSGASGSPAETDPAAADVSGCSEETEDVGDLSGAWEADDDGVYYIRQMGDCVWWFGTSLEAVGEGEQEGFANVAVGRIVEDTIYVEWADVPLGSILGGGTLTLEITPTGALRLVDASEWGFGAMFWFRRQDGASPSPSGDASEGASPSSP